MIKAKRERPQDEGGGIRGEGGGIRDEAGRMISGTRMKKPDQDEG